MERRKYKLNFEMVPEECWYSNLRTALSKSDWNKIRFDAYRRAEGKCMICGTKTSRLEAHERWDYDEKKAVQKLVTVIAVCNSCHQVIHIGRTQLMGNEWDAMEHFMRVNKCSQSEYHEALGKANEEYKRRNKVDGWVTDLSWIKEKFDIVPPKYINNTVFN